jgi:hypothetical protein
MNFNGFSNKRIPDLASAVTITGEEYVSIFQDGTLKKVTVSQISAGTGTIQGGVPVGGEAGQFLRKSGSENYQTEWTTLSWQDFKMDLSVIEEGTSATASVNQIVIGKSSNESPFSLNLPASPESGDQILVKDAKGDASNNNLTIFGNGKDIDGLDTIIINRNYGSIKLVYNGTEWNVLSAIGYGDKAVVGRAIVGISMVV